MMLLRAPPRRSSLSTKSSFAIRFPSVFAEKPLDIWMWNKAEGDLLNPGDVLIAASASNFGNARYSFTLPTTFSPAYLSRIVTTDFERNLGCNRTLGLISSQKPVPQTLASILLGMKSHSSKTVQQHQENPMLIFDDLLKEKNGRRLCKLLKYLDQGNRFRLFSALATDANVKHLLTLYRDEDLFCMWENLNAAGHHPALRDAMLKELSSREVAKLSPFLISRLVDAYPNMDAFFGMLIAVDAKAPAEQQMEIILNEVEEGVVAELPPPKVVAMSSSSSAPMSSNSKQSIEASQVPLLGPRKLLTPRPPINSLLESQSSPPPVAASAPATIASDLTTATAPATVAPARAVTAPASEQPPVAKPTTRSASKKPLPPPMVNDEQAIERGAIDLYAWLLEKGGSSAMHKMGEFYTEFPETGAAIQEYGVGNLDKWFQVEKTARGFSLRIRANSKPPTMTMTSLQVANALVKFLKARGGSCKTGMLQEFYEQNPAAKESMSGSFKQFALEHSTNIMLEHATVTLVKP